MSSILRNISSARDLIALSGTCTNWRKLALEEKGHLSNVHFTIDHKKPFSNSERAFQAEDCEHLPAIFSKVGLYVVVSLNI